MARARQCYERAIRLDPQYAAPYAALAEYHYLLGIYGQDPFRVALPLATAAAERAIELDAGSADAYSARGAFRAHEYEWEAARADFIKALGVNPAHALSRFRYALFYLRMLGRNEEAAAEMARAIESDPLHPHIRCYEIGVLVAAGRHADAVDRARLSIETFPSFWAGVWLCAVILTQSGFPEEALSAVRVASAAHPANPYLMAAEACAVSAMGQAESARALLSQLDELSTRQSSPFALTLACAACGDFGRAFQALDRGVEESDAFTLFFHDVAPIPGLREDPRYRAIRRKLTLD
jgi:Flp pilus assembly protein TadD